MKKWELLATLVTPRPFSGHASVHHVRIATDRTRLLCSCTTTSVTYHPELLDIPPYAADRLPYACVHIAALYTGSGRVTTVNFTALGREIFYAKYALRAMS